MKVLTEGHRYEASNFEKLTETGQIIQFIEKRPADDDPKILETVNDGTTNEELIEILINRIQYLNGKFPCRENSIALTKLDEALLWLNKRTSDRVKRYVEGKNIA
jgi:hypothetical protein